jgi:hypothetical protein
MHCSAARVRLIPGVARGASHGGASHSRVSHGDAGHIGWPGTFHNISVP